MPDELTWFDQANRSEERPNQWYWEGEPCDLVAVGFATVDGRKKAAALRFQMADGSFREDCFKNGKAQHSTYETYDHQPGNA